MIKTLAKFTIFEPRPESRRSTTTAPVSIRIENEADGVSHQPPLPAVVRVAYGDGGVEGLCATNADYLALVREAIWNG